ncbi:MAG: DISARM system helicase DrmA [Candidatus Thermoplasmatota archaeon]|nr:DISARM system helicase DrmA [Candidatus Thermoplasmatota archaeon]MCL5963890.1 DISARM system helicase DrmA [Candidatus Thermoplasmatota archaeon]
MRDKIIEELIKYVYGPRDGSVEVISADPIKEYISGVIIPKGCRQHPDITPDSENTVTGGNDPLEEDGSEEDMIADLSFSEIDPKVKPSVFGIAFTVSGKNAGFKVCVTWGKYSRESTGNWKRTPFKLIEHHKINDDEKGIKTYESYGIKLYIKHIKKDGENYMIIINVLNDSVIESSKCTGNDLTEASIFQPSLRIRLDNGFKLSPFPVMHTSSGDKTFPFLYRNKPILARGMMCSAIWSDIEYPENYEKFLWPDGNYFENEGCEEFKKPDVRSDFLPLYADSSPDLEWDAGVVKPPELSALRLSELWDFENLKQSIVPLTDAYSKWIEINVQKAQNINSDHKNVALSIIDQQRKFLNRLKTGMDLLSDKNVRLSFCFANRVIWLQNKWNGKNDFKWKPFQLAFLLINMVPLHDTDSEYRDCVDLLWISTGAGKTEAYLAIMAFLMALRRLKAGEKQTTGGGTAIISRYTLRLLTTQQFRRILRMVTAAEYLRVQKDGHTGWRPDGCDIDKEWIYGSIRFSAGLWVGGTVTPNHLRKKDGAIDALEPGNGSAEGEPAQITTCPACGSWLSVPEDGLPVKRGNELYILLKTPQNFQVNNFITQSNSILADIPNVTVNKIEIIQNPINLKTGYVCFKWTLNSEQKLSKQDIDDMWKKVAGGQTGIEPVQFRPSRPGYFGIRKEPGRKNKKFADFEIYCLNPECDLNKVSYMEGVPLCCPDEDKGRISFPDGLVARNDDDTPFDTPKIPIPAYTVDEQIYHRCPTIIVSTADKIARLAFEPRAAGIMGNIDKYNDYYGYYRGDLLPEETTKAAVSNSVGVKPFDPPELILQDELHLMDGSLGSMFGLYETVVESLIKKIGGTKGPKYVASTATIKDAKIQIMKLFARDVIQFPPNGLDIDDSFFVRNRSVEKSWNEQTAGRIYVGICSPGWGQLTPNIRIWANLLMSCNKNKADKNIKYFWTIVGYFNSIRELGGAGSIYGADIVENLHAISNGNPRNIDPSNTIELSSRINSTEIPQILDNLEKNNHNYDAIFTTSMFGTGVDIPYLSLMVVNGQPKTTTQYIQATGRIGRTHGGIVVTFLSAGKPRDLSHYEMFPAYHLRKYLEVEPVSVNPYAEGCLAMGSGPATVAFLRNFQGSAVDWTGKDNGTAILEENSDKDIDKFIDVITPRLQKICGDSVDSVIQYFKSQLDLWKNVANATTSGLSFVEYPHKKPAKNVVLGDPYHKKAKLKIVYENAPQSLREVEETIGFKVD